METSTKPVPVTVLLWPDDWHAWQRRGKERGRSGSSMLRDLLRDALRGSVNPSAENQPVSA